MARFNKGQKFLAKKPRPVTANFVPEQSGRSASLQLTPIQCSVSKWIEPFLHYSTCLHGLRWDIFKDVRWQFETSTDNPCLVTAVVSTLKFSGWRHVESYGRKKKGVGGGVLDTHFSLIYMELQGRIKGIFVNTSKQNLPFQNNVITLQSLSQGRLGPASSI